MKLGSTLNSSKRKQVSAIREFYGLRGCFTGQVQHISGILDFALTVFHEKSVLFRENLICADNSIHKVSAKDKIRDLH